MNKRAKTSRQNSLITVISAWVGSLLSVGLLILTGHIVIADIGSLRSCNDNTNRMVTNCGKQSLNFNDAILVILFVLSAILVVTLFSLAWRLSRSRHE